MCQNLFQITCSDASVEVHPEHFWIRQGLLGKRQLPLHHVPGGAPVIKPRDNLKFAETAVFMLLSISNVFTHPINRVPNNVEIGRRPRRSEASEVDKVVMLHPGRVRRGAVNGGHKICHQSLEQKSGV